MNVEKSDLFYILTIDLSILPWRPSRKGNTFFCDIKHPDGSAFEGDSRNILKKAVERAEKMGYACRIGSECEFYLFETDEKEDPHIFPMMRGIFGYGAP